MSRGKKNVLIQIICCDTLRRRGLDIDRIAEQQSFQPSG